MDGLQDTCHCILSLLTDGFDEKEILVWDNGSSKDDAGSLERQFGDSIRVFRSPKNIGYAAGNNRAAGYARSDILIFLNNDTEVTKGWLDPLVSALYENKNLAACQPKLRSLVKKDYFDSAGGAGGFVDAWGYPYICGRVISTQERDDGQYDAPVDIDWACGACIAVRKKDFLDEGGFDEDFFAYLEEVDLCWKWRRRCRSIALVPKSVVYHRGGLTWRNRKHLMLYHKHRNGLLVLLKHLSCLQLMKILPLRLSLEWCAAVFYLYHGSPSQSFAPLRSFFAFFFFAPRIFRKRMQLPYPSLRRVRVLPEYFLFGKKTFSSLSSLESLHEAKQQAR